METAKIIKNQDLLAYLRRFHRKDLSTNEVNAWKKALQSLQKVKQRHFISIWREHLRMVRGVQKRHDTKSEKVFTKPVVEAQTTGTYYCPNCGEQLALRSGKFGEFYGCSAFPVCRYTVDVWRVNSKKSS